MNYYYCDFDIHHYINYIKLKWANVAHLLIP